MIEDYLKKIKFDFVLIIILLILCFSMGIFFLKDETFSDINDLLLSLISLNTPKKKIQANYLINARSVPVLLYHGIVNKPDGKNITLDSFEIQMKMLKEYGWSTISIEDFEDYVAGRKNLPDKSILITFDDGRQDSLKADPILKELEYSAVMFVIAGYTRAGNNFYLSENQIRQMAESGRWDFGSHSMWAHNFYNIGKSSGGGHFISNKLWLNGKNRLETDEEYRDRIDSDLISSKDYLEKILNKNIDSFAFPYGDYGQENSNYPQSQQIIFSDSKKYYPILFYQERSGELGKFNYYNQNSYLYKRIEVKPTWKANDLLNTLNDYREKELPLHLDYGKALINECIFNACKLKKQVFLADVLGNWKSRYGNTDNIDGYIQLESGPDSNGSSMVINGAKTWRNYQYSATIDWEKGSDVGLIARFMNENNFLSCDFSKNWWSIKNKINGQEITISEGEITPGLSDKNLNLSISIQDNKAECLVNGQVVGDGIFDDSLSEGGIGLVTWDQEKNNSQLVLKSVDVY